MPPLDQFPRAHVVTFRYYLGVLAFLNEEYAKVGKRHEQHAADECRTEARRLADLKSPFLAPPFFWRPLLQAETELTFALNNCHRGATRNLESVPYPLRPMRLI